MSDIFSPQDFEWYQRQRLTPPERLPHGTEESIGQNLGGTKVQKWLMRGNMLIGITSAGEFGQPIPTGYILHGTDSDNKPILKKVQLQPPR